MNKICITDIAAIDVKEAKMIQEIEPKRFDNQYRENVRPSGEDRVFLFERAEKGADRICLSLDGDTIDVPRWKDTIFSEEDLVYLFSIDDEKFFLAFSDCEAVCPEGFAFCSNRALRKAQPKYLAFAAMTAAHLHTWYRDNRYCGSCGAKTEHDKKERMMRCPVCGTMIFPKINPAVTVALLHEGKLLVTKYAGRQQTNLYALIAGFVEIGESAEECVKREVMEEVGLKAVNVRYYGSQPWGFAGNLQMGYVAEVEGDATITLDQNELAEAFFIAREELEYNPNRPALTQEMIEAFRAGRL